MCRGFPIFIRLQEDGPRQTRYGASGIGWLTMVPGLGVTGVALAMLIWPALLAYFVASILLCAGVALTVLGWRMRHLTQDARQPRHRTPPLDRSPWDA